MKVYGPDQGVVKETKLKEIKNREAGKGKEAVVKEARVKGGETVALSEKAKEIQKAKDIANAASDVRIEKVAELKDKIEKGKYHVNSRDIADKMLKDVIGEAI